MSFSLSHQTPIREELLRIMQAALDAVNPSLAVQRVLRREDDLLYVQASPPLSFSLAEFERIVVLGAGKAAAPMAQAVEAILGEWLTDGMVVVKYDHLAPLSKIKVHQAAHPVPDEAGLAAGEAILTLAKELNEQDLVLCLLSGGGSALLEALPASLTLADLQETTALLLACGATINEINTIRKHLSLLKGGQLAQAVAPATLITLVLSDVVGSPLDVIASGPTVADSSSWIDVANIMARYDLSMTLPLAVRERIAAGRLGKAEETPKPDNPLFAKSYVIVIGDNAQAAKAAQRKAQQLGYQSLILTTFLEGEAREVAKFAVALGREMQHYARPCAPPACLILGGETTVTFKRSPTLIGQGGRNQELALAAAIELIDYPGITIGTFATDGTDGPTDSAGAIVDHSTHLRATSCGFSLRKHLDDHNAYPLLHAIGDLLHSGPTNTNVNDLLFVLVK